MGTNFEDCSEVTHSDPAGRLRQLLAEHRQRSLQLGRDSPDRARLFLVRLRVEGDRRRRGRLQSPRLAALRHVLSGVHDPCVGVYMSALRRSLFGRLGAGLGKKGRGSWRYGNGEGPTCLERCVMLTSRAEELGVVIPHVIRRKIFGECTP